MAHAQPIALFSTSRTLIPRVLGALSSVQHRPVSTWAELEDAVRACRCTVMVMEWLVRGGALEPLRRFRARHPSHPVVLVTREDPENARCLNSLEVEVLWVREIEQRLRHAVMRTRSQAMFHQVAAELDRAEHLPPRLRRALGHACTTPNPLRSVNSLAKAVGCHRGTLWTQWSRTVPPGTLRLEDFLDWVLLISAAERKEPGVSWSAVADQLHVHQHTLARVARRLTGHTLRQVENGGTNVACEFAERVLPALLGKEAPRYDVAAD
jgi:AraC-like DNA-binding protein